MSSTGNAKAARVVIGLHGLGTLFALFGWLLGLGHVRSNLPEQLFNLFNIPVNASLVSVVVLAVVFEALLRRKRIGWWAAVSLQLLGVYLGVATILHITPWDPLPEPPFTLAAGFDVASVPIGLAALLLLWKLRPEFAGRLRPGSWLAAGAMALAGITVTATFTFFAVSISRPDNDQTTFADVVATLARSAGLRSRWSDLG